MSPKKKSIPSTTNKVTGDKNIIIVGDVKDSVVITGEHNTVNQTITQKFFNIFKSDSGTLKQRLRLLMEHFAEIYTESENDTT